MGRRPFPSAPAESTIDAASFFFFKEKNVIKSIYYFKMDFKASNSHKDEF